MVDLETTHTAPDRGGIIQIAAVKFNLQERTVDSDFFDRCLFVPNHRHWSESTRSWWHKQKKETLEGILTRAENPHTVIGDFADWAYPVHSLRFWSKPSHFDFMFLSSYFADCGIANPFSYREAMDMNSFLRGRYYPSSVPDIDVPFTGDAHNALADTLHQLRILLVHTA